MKYTLYKSPIGTITISCNEEDITGLHIEGDRYSTDVPQNWEHAPKSPLLQKAGTQLNSYFAGTLKQFDLPLFLHGTSFQKEVWNAVLHVPYGQTSSYTKMSRHVGRPKAVRAVGSAVGRNMICIIIPCHRILASNGALGGYVAGLARKQFLLDLEQKNK